MVDLNYWIPRPSDEWASRLPATPEEEAFDKLNAAGVLRVVKRAMASDEEKQAADQFHKDYKVFFEMYPTYVDNEHNKNAMVHHWREVLGVTIPTLEQLEECFFTLRESGLLQLDAKEVAKENKAAIAKSAETIRTERAAREFNEADAYSMSMEELKDRAMGRF